MEGSAFHALPYWSNLDPTPYGMPRPWSMWVESVLHSGPGWNRQFQFVASGKLRNLVWPHPYTTTKTAFLKRRCKGLRNSSECFFRHRMLFHTLLQIQISSVIWRRLHAFDCTGSVTLPLANTILLIAALLNAVRTLYRSCDCSLPVVTYACVATVDYTMTTENTCF